MNEKTATRQLMLFQSLNKYVDCHIKMGINPNKATAYVQTRISTSPETESKIDNPYIVRPKLQCFMVHLVKDSRKMSEHCFTVIVGENQIIQ